MFLRTTTDQQKFRGFMIMAEIDGERGHGYFYPAKASLKMANPVDCKNLPESCQDESCQVAETMNNVIYAPIYRVINNKFTMFEYQ